MIKKELIESCNPKSLQRKFISGPFHIFNPVPMNEEEAVAHGNALTKSGNYPVGTSECFNVGISGGCGPDCFVYLKGECDEPEEMIERLDEKELILYQELYGVTKQEESK